MSGETSSYDQQVELKKTPNIKVDINDLLSRVRDEKKKERKENCLKKIKIIFIFYSGCRDWIQ